MPVLSSPQRSILLFSIALIFCSFLGAKTKPMAKKGGWYEITTEELEAKAPKIDPDAACEFLYRELRVNDIDIERTSFYHYRKAKIYTEAGVEEWNKVDVLYQTGWYIRDLKARVTYPDGTVSELDKKDIFKRKIFKEDRFEGNSQSFSFPGLKPGCIIEYRWTQVRKYWVPGLEIELRAEWPTWHFSSTIKPYRGFASSMRIFNALTKWERTSDGFIVDLKDQPAKSDKPQLAARKDFEPFVALVYASSIDQFDSEKYWGYRGGALIEVNREFVKLKNREVKELAKELFADLPMDEDKLKAAYSYCTDKLINIDEYTSVYTEDEIEELDDNDSPGDTIKHGYGSRYDINAVFASLCAAGGFSAYLAQVEDHREFSFASYAIGGFNLSDWVVAVGYGEGWRYFDPGSSFLPFEILNPNNAGSQLIVADKKYYYMRKTSLPTVEFSQSSRIGNVSIDEFGDLRAEVKLSYTGYAGLWRKRLFAPMTVKEREDYILENDWKSRLPRAEIEDFEIKNAGDREKALFLSYTVKVPGYADVLGNRLIFNPSIFEKSAVSLFTDKERTEPIAFDYLPLTLDKVIFRLPEGYVLEDKDAAHGKRITELMERKSVFEQDSEAGTYTFQRQFSVKLRTVYGHNYEFLKSNFDYLLEADSRVVSFSKGSDS